LVYGRAGFDQWVMAMPVAATTHSRRHYGIAPTSGRGRMNATTRTPRTRLSLALVLAILAPGQALAQAASPPDLEARIAQLEQMVQGLKAELEAQKVAVPAAPAPLPAGTQPIQATSVMPAANPGTRFGFGGFIKLDALVSDTSDGEIPDGSPGRLFYLPSATPVGSVAEDDPDLDVHAQFSRFWFSADTDLEGHKLKAYIEACLLYTSDAADDM
jgi:hypothetical protein